MEAQPLSLPVVVPDGCLVERRTARRMYMCNGCQGPLMRVGEEYYSVTWGKGLGVLKFPDRVHVGCLETYFEKRRKAGK